MKPILLFILFSLSVTSCSTYPDEVIQSLKLSGDNKEELVEVLEYCKSIGELEYKAACYLISNMKYHKSDSCIILKDSHVSFFKETDSLYNIIFDGMDYNSIFSFKSLDYEDVRKRQAEKFSVLPRIRIEKEKRSDLECIKADYLINNIIFAFKEWHHNPLLKDMDFDTFKEFILPYRSTNESTMYKRSEIKKIWQNEFSKENPSDISALLGRYKAYATKCKWINYYTKPKDHTGIYDLFLPRFKMDCHNMTNWSCNIFRASGIPVVYEYTPKWIDRERRHFWCCSPDSSGIYQPYTAPDNNLREDWEEHIKYAGKVYRRTFGANKNTPFFLAGKTEYIPQELATPLLSDQTFRYHQTVTLRIPLNEYIESNLAYLCMPGRDGLTPVAWGKIDKKKKVAVFEHVPINIIFLPVYYKGREMKSINSLFMIKSSGEINYIPLPLTTNSPEHICDVTLKGEQIFYTNNLNEEPLGLKFLQISPKENEPIDITLLRKYPDKRGLKLLREKLVGGAFLGSNDNKHYDTLFVLNQTPEPYLQEIKLKNQKQYRFYKFELPDGGNVNIAHLEFLAPYSKIHNCLDPMVLPRFKPEIPEEQTNELYNVKGKVLETVRNPRNAFDGNFETWAGSPFICVDFTNPIKITHIRFVPRNANNMIVVGDNYRLSYFNKDSWKIHTTKKAKDNYLTFENVPSGTIYMLANIDNGVDELPFFYIKNQQFFINIDDFDSR